MNSQLFMCKGLNYVPIKLKKSIQFRLGNISIGLFELFRVCKTKALDG